VKTARSQPTTADKEGVMKRILIMALFLVWVSVGMGLVVGSSGCDDGFTGEVTISGNAEE
jgi:hypothetical protein